MSPDKEHTMNIESEGMLNGDTNGMGRCGINDLAEMCRACELVHRLALLDAYQRFVHDHPQDTVLAVDTNGRVWGASPAITQWLAAPQQLLGQALLGVPGLRVEGWCA